MTFGSLVKAFLFRRYGRAWRRVSQQATQGKASVTQQWRKTNVANDSSVYTKPPTSKGNGTEDVRPTVPWDDFTPSAILLVDATGKIKNNYFSHGLDFVHKGVLKEAASFLSNHSSRGVYLCFDILPRQINKQILKVKTQKLSPKPIPMTRVDRMNITQRHIRLAKLARSLTREVYDNVEGEEEEEHITDEETALLKEETYIVIDDTTPIIDDFSCPTHDEWKAFIKNKYLFPEMVYYLTDRIINPHPTEPAYTFHIPPNKFLYLWGGNLIAPPPRSARITTAISDIEMCTYENSVFFVGNTFDPLGQQYNRECGRTVPSTFNAKLLTNLKEAEISLMYFLTMYPDEDITVLSGDGDLIFILLLASRNRINLEGKWRNTVYLRLMHGGKSFNGFSSTPEVKQVEEININTLYDCIMEDSSINVKQGIADPVLILAVLSNLVENDYVQDFGFGLGNVDVSKVDGKVIYHEGKKSDEDATKWYQMPTILQTFLNDPPKFANLVKYYTDARHHHFSHISSIRIDEALFITFTRECYVTKYKDQCAKKMKKEMKHVAAADVRHYLYKLRGKPSSDITSKNCRSRMMTQRIIRIYCRMSYWTINYWANGYKGDGSFPGSPLKQLDGLSFYGYSSIMLKNGRPKCVMANVVSRWVPLDAKYITLDSFNLNQALSPGDVNLLSELFKPRQFSVLSNLCSTKGGGVNESLSGKKRGHPEPDVVMSTKTSTPIVRSVSKSGLELERIFKEHNDEDQDRGGMSRPSKKRKTTEVSHDIRFNPMTFGEINL